MNVLSWIVNTRNKKRYTGIAENLHGRNGSFFIFFSIFASYAGIYMSAWLRGAKQNVTT